PDKRDLLPVGEREVGNINDRDHRPVGSDVGLAYIVQMNGHADIFSSSGRPCVREGCPRRNKVAGRLLFLLSTGKAVGAPPTAPPAVRRTYSPCARSGHPETTRRK